MYIPPDNTKYNFGGWKDIRSRYIDPVIYEMVQKGMAEGQMHYSVSGFIRDNP